MTSIATRHMWSRRVQAFFLHVKNLKQIFHVITKIPAPVFVFIGLAGFAYLTTIDDRVAPPETIQAYLNNDICMQVLMPKRQKQVGRALRIKDLKDGKDDCTKAVEVGDQLRIMESYRNK